MGAHDWGQMPGGVSVWRCKRCGATITGGRAMCPSHGCSGKVVNYFGQTKAVNDARNSIEAIAARKGHIGLVYVFKRTYPMCWDWVLDSQGLLLQDANYKVIKSLTFKEALELLGEN